MIRLTALAIVALAIVCDCTFGGETKNDKQPHVVFVVNEDEYHAAETMPVFAQLLRDRYDCRCTMLLGRDHEIPGLEALKTADSMVLFVRRKTLPRVQLGMIRAYLDAGKPLVALRTACHAFAANPKAKPKVEPPEGSAQWPAFDVEVLGCHYTGHYANKAGTDLALAAGASGHPILAGIDPASWHSNGSLYKVLPLEAGVTVLMTGKFGESVEPVVWTRTYREGRVFCTSLGAPDDFKSPQFQRLLINAVHWGMSRPAGPQIRQ